jgi:hypothetical protein
MPSLKVARRDRSDTTDDHKGDCRDHVAFEPDSARSSAWCPELRLPRRNAKLRLSFAVKEPPARPNRAMSGFSGPGSSRGEQAARAQHCHRRVGDRRHCRSEFRVWPSPASGVTSLGEVLDPLKFPGEQRQSYPSGRSGLGFSHAIQAVVPGPLLVSSGSVPLSGSSATRPSLRQVRPGLAQSGSVHALRLVRLLSGPTGPDVRLPPLPG